MAVASATPILPEVWNEIVPDVRAATTANPQNRLRLVLQSVQEQNDHVLGATLKPVDRLFVNLPR